jgi:hypothetical protein
MNGKITVTKVDQMAEKPKVEERKPVALPMPLPIQKTAGKKGGKTMKTFPRGVLKTAKQKLHLRPVSDPAKPPPLKKTMKQHTIQLMTDKGVRRHRKTLRKSISKMSDQKVKELVTKYGLLKNKDTPASVMREMLEGGAIAGFVSLS